MKRKTIDAAREARLWVGQIIVPTATAVAAIFTIPEVRQSAAIKAEEIKYNIQKRMRRRP